MLKTLPTQFDNKKLTSSVATPTCSSCCCCCCCIATALSASSIANATVASEARRHKILQKPNAVGAQFLLALVIPIIVFTYYPAGIIVGVILGVIISIFVLAYSFRKVGSSTGRSLAMSIGVVVLVASALITEFFIALMALFSAGGVFFLVYIAGAVALAATIIIRSSGYIRKTYK